MKSHAAYPAEVVVLGAATGDAREEHHDAVVLGVRAVVARERRVPEQALTRAGREADRVHVERVLPALAQLVLHRRLLRRVGADIVEPFRVHGARGARERPGDAGACVVLVQNVDLAL